MNHPDRTVLLVDDHAIFRAGLVGVLARLDVPLRVREAPDLLAALDALGSGPQPDLIVYDWGLKPGLGGFAGLLAIRQAAGSVPVLVLSSAASDEMTREADYLGAVQTLSKGDETSLIAAAMLKWLDPQAPRSRPGAGSAAVTLPAPRLPGEPAGLTRRQREILTRVARGRTNKTIAAELGVELATVRTHVSNILERLQAHNRTEAVVIATRSGLL